MLRQAVPQAGVGRLGGAHGAFLCGPSGDRRADWGTAKDQQSEGLDAVETNADTNEDSSHMDTDDAGSGH